MRDVPIGAELEAKQAIARAIGSLTDQDGQFYILLICAECDYMHGLEKHMFDHEYEGPGYSEDYP